MQECQEFDNVLVKQPITNHVSAKMNSQVVSLQLVYMRPHDEGTNEEEFIFMSGLALPAGGIFLLQGL